MQTKLNTQANNMLLSFQRKQYEEFLAKESKRSKADVSQLSENESHKSHVDADLD